MAESAVISEGTIRTGDFELSPCVDPGWLLTEEGVAPAREREIESLFAIGNGFVGVRASIAEGNSFSHPATFVAGIYVADGSLGPRLAVFPNWLHVEVSVEGDRLSIEAGHVLAHRRRLDLRQGVLWREWRQRTDHAIGLAAACISRRSARDPAIGRNNRRELRRQNQRRRAFEPFGHHAPGCGTRHC